MRCTARSYGYADEVAELEILDVRVSAVGVTPKPRLAKLEVREGPPPEPGVREIFYAGRTWRAGVYQRADLPVGFSFEGPAIVDQYDTTIFITPRVPSAGGTSTAT